MDDKILNKLVDAITASGKKFNDINKKLITDFLIREGIRKDRLEDEYNAIAKLFNKKNKAVIDKSGWSTSDMSTKVDKRNLTANVDYSDSSHNDVKKREPRKNVFSEIKRIA